MNSAPENMAQVRVLANTVMYFWNQGHNFELRLAELSYVTPHKLRSN